MPSFFATCIQNLFPRLTHVVLAGLCIFATTAHAITPQEQARADSAFNSDTPRPAVRPADTSKISIAKKDSTADTTGSTIDTIRYEADDISYDLSKTVLTLTGNSKIAYQNITLFADTIVFRTGDDLFVAQGHPMLVESADTTVGDWMIYNITTRRGRVKYASTHMNKGFFNGENIYKTANNDFYVENGDYTTCQYPEHPHYYFYGLNTKVVPSTEIISRPVVFNIGEAPVAIFPYFIFPLQRGRKSGFLTPVFGGHPNSGGYLDNVGYYWAINDYADAKASLRIEEFQNIVFSAAGQYVLKYWLSGNVSGQYTRSGDFLKQRNQWSLNYSHQQNITPDGSFTLSGSGNLVSSRDYYTTYSQDTADYLKQTANASMTLYKRFDAINASASLSWQRQMDLSNNHISEQIPGFSFTLLTRPLFPTAPTITGAIKPDDPKWYNSISYSYSANALVKREAYDPDSIRQKGYIHGGISQNVSISAPQTFLSYITVNPSFNISMSSFDASIGDSAIDWTMPDTTYDTIARPIPLNTRVLDTITNSATGDTQFVVTKSIFPLRPSPVFDTSLTWYNAPPTWNAGVSVSTNLYGLFPVKIFNLAGLRHTVSPSISYTFRPKEDQIDRTVFPIGIPAPGNQKQSQTVGLSLGNSFQAKLVTPGQVESEKPKEEKINLVSASVSTGYDFERRGKADQPFGWSPIALSASTNITNALSITYSSGYFVYDENEELIVPALSNYSVRLGTGNISASGTLWGGDLFDLNGISLNSSGPKASSSGNPGWSLSLSPSYSFSSSRNSPTDVFVPNRQYSLTTSANLNYTKIWSLSWGGYYNFVTGQLVGHSIDLHCDLECWDLRFNWRPSGVNTGYYFLITLKEIPEVKWEKRN